MASLAKNTKATIVPCLSYRDAAAATEWLGETFGFEKHAVYPGEGGTIMHAVLSVGNGMIMRRSKNDGSFGRWTKQPEKIGGCETHAAYPIVSDADAIYAPARAADTAILIDIKDEDYGGRGFTCRDREGHAWSFGTYDPWISK